MVGLMTSPYRQELAERIGKLRHGLYLRLVRVWDWGTETSEKLHSCCFGAGTACHVSRRLGSVEEALSVEIVEASLELRHSHDSKSLLVKRCFCLVAPHVRHGFEPEWQDL